MMSIIRIAAVRLRTCLKNTLVGVRTAHQPLKAPEGRKVCNTIETPRT